MSYAMTRSSRREDSNWGTDYFTGGKGEKGVGTVTGVVLFLGLDFCLGWWCFFRGVRCWVLV
ncbi:MAG: hypothetical protein JWN25_1610 [Verrucomicrobiales bacterium]|nr:hypothetical protein [Verrucomicrobiales bacterium]